MPYIEVVTLLAVIEYIVFLLAVGKARGKYQVDAPATTGHPIFERYYRVQMNTLEQLITFIPSLWVASRYIAPEKAAMIGIVYVIGRLVYFRSYIQDPNSRALGFALSFLPIVTLIGIGLLGACKSILA